MITSVKSISLKTTPELSFAAVSDPFIMEKWYSGMSDVKELTNFPLNKGSVFTCKIRLMGTMRFEFASFQPYEGLIHDSVMWLGTGNHTFTFVPDGDTILFTQIMQLKLHGFGWFLWPFMKLILNSGLEKQNRELKVYLEG